MVDSVSGMMTSFLSSATTMNQDTMDYLKGVDATDPTAMLSAQFKLGTYSASLTAFSNSVKAMTDLAQAMARNFK